MVLITSRLLGQTLVQMLLNDKRIRKTAGSLNVDATHRNTYCKQSQFSTTQSTQHLVFA